MARKVAFVTGASRGIGKACAVHLVRAGFDVAITARTVSEGEQRKHSLCERGILSGGAPPDVMGAVVAWFATSAEAWARNGEAIEAQYFCHELELLPGWEGAWVGAALATKYERPGARLSELEERRRRELGIS
jgi:hypothetical protein